MRLKKREEEKEDPEDSFPTLEAFLSASSIHGLRYLRGAGRGSSGKAFPILYFIKDGALRLKILNCRFPPPPPHPPGAVDCGRADLGLPGGRHDLDERVRLARAALRRHQRGQGGRGGGSQARDTGFALAYPARLKHSYLYNAINRWPTVTVCPSSPGKVGLVRIGRF